MIKRVIVTVLFVVVIMAAIIFGRPSAVGNTEPVLTDKITTAISEVKNIEPEVEEVIVEEAEPKEEEEIIEEPEEEIVEEIEEYYEEQEVEYVEEEYYGGMSYIGTFEITAYEWTGNPCANGNYPTEGYTVACNSLPLGTQVYIDGIGYRTVEDRGASWHGDSWMDLYLGDTSSCYAFGRQYLDVYVVD